MAKREYLAENKIIIDISETDKDAAVVVLNGEKIFESPFIHYLQDRVSNDMYRYKNINAHEDFISNIKKEILNEHKTFVVIFSKNIMNLLYPEKKKETPIDISSFGMVL